MSEYIRVVDGKIVSAHCGPVPTGSEYHVVPKGWPYFSLGVDIRNFDKDWKLLPIDVRIKMGLVKLSDTEIVDGEIVRAKTAIERYKSGIDKLPLGMKIVNDELKNMTRLEQVQAGQLSPEVAYSLDLQDWEIARKTAYQDESDPIYMMAIRREKKQNEESYSMEDWKIKIEEIKKRYPKPHNIYN